MHSSSSHPHPAPHSASGTGKSARCGWAGRQSQSGGGTVKRTKIIGGADGEARQGRLREGEAKAEQEMKAGGQGRRKQQASRTGRLRVVAERGGTGESLGSKSQFHPLSLLEPNRWQ